MQKTASKNLAFIDPSSKAILVDPEKAVINGEIVPSFLLNELARGYHSHQSIQVLARRLIKLARHAFNLRDFGKVHQASSLLTRLPLVSAQQVGLYYQAHALSGSGNIGEARSLLEQVAEYAPVRYRARATQALGMLHLKQGQLADAMRLYVEASQLAARETCRDTLTVLLSGLNISVIKSFNDDHSGALSDLKNLLPLVRLVAPASPFYFYLYYGDLAYELAQIGYVAEAEAAIAVPLNSPFASAYPEWSETREEIAAKRQSASQSQTALSRRAKPAPNRSIRSKPNRKQTPAAFGVAVARRQGVLYAAPLSAGHTAIVSSLLQYIHKCIRPRSPPVTR